MITRAAAARRRHPLLDAGCAGMSASRHIDIEIDSLSVAGDFLNLNL
ncbi:hypothetical protein BSLA_01r3544 [Burkholderia stabilis]|nr:hypothetical protein BSLA_01r3544 [Burkholderia stabilis]